MITRRQKSFSLVEVILSIALFAMLISLMAGAIIYARGSNFSVSNRSRAMDLAREGIEASKEIRNADFANLTDGQYGISIVNGAWTLISSQDTTGIFTRTLTVSTVDGNTKKVAVNVGWVDVGTKQNTVSLESLITNWKTTQPSDWTDPGDKPVDLPDTFAGLKIQIQGNYAYVIQAGSTNNFSIIDVTDPSIPKIKSSLTLPGTPTNIAVSGNYAYVSNRDSNQNMQIIDITNPESPIFNSANSFKGIGNEPATGIFVQGNRAYLTREYKQISNSPTFYVVDISNPTVPTALSYIRLKEPVFNLPISAYDVYASGSYAYVAAGFFQTGLGLVPYLVAIDITQPQAVVKKSYTPFSLTNLRFGNAVSVSGYGNRVVLGQEGPANNLYVYDVTDPLNAQLNGTYNIGGRPNDLAFGPNNQFTYIASDSPTAEFQVVDVSNPSSLQKISSIDLSDMLNGICYSSGKDRVFAVGPNPNSEFFVINPFK